MKNGSSPGIDKITTDLFKKHNTIFCIPLCHIFNLCISQNLILDNFKVTIITPIHKKGPTTSFSNFRPISVISNIAKIFKKIIKKKLLDFLESNNLFFKYQFGFRPSKDTDQAIDNVTKTIYTALEEGKKWATIYLDLTKAFDTVDHKILLNKMNSIGISGSALSLFTSHLNNRKQMVSTYLRIIFEDEYKYKRYAIGYSTQ